MSHLRGPNSHIRRGSNPNRDPLRKIVSEYVGNFGRRMERLECGHEIAQRQDFMGPTNALRRRCHHCAREQREKTDETP